MSQSSLMAWLTKPSSKKPSSNGESIASVNQATTAVHNTTRDDSTSPRVRQDAKRNDKNPLPDNVELRACRAEDIPHLRRLISLLLPIPYPDKFYKETIEDQVTNSITLLAMWHDNPAIKSEEKGRLIGAVRCRLLAHPPTPEQTARREGPMLYLSTLVLLSPYRGHGIAARMLDILTRRAVDDYGVTSIGAHVWEANEEGQEWYRKRGFEEVAREPQYYPRLTPKGAVVLRRNISVLDFVGG